MKKIPEHLPIHMVLQLANAACEKYGFKELTGSELNTMFTTKKVLPPVARATETGILWIDKWYVAVQIGDGDVEYLYLTRHHVNEELYSYRILKRLRESAPTLPSDIMEQFRVARSWMDPIGDNLYFSKAAEELGLKWISSWREAARKDLRILHYNIPSEKRSA